MDRRRFLQSALAVAAAGAPLSAVGGCSPSATRVTVQPLHSDIVASSYGVQIHASFRDTVYSQYPAVQTLLRDLGTRSVRDRLAPEAPESVAFLMELGRVGIRTNATLGTLVPSDSDRVQLAAVVRGAAAALDSIAGYNEPNDPGRPSNWAVATVDHQSWLAELGRELGRPVCGPSLRQSATVADDYRELAALGLADYCDVLGIHSYPNGSKPSTGLDTRISAAQHALGEKPVYCTEGGYFTAVNFAGVGSPVSEEVQAAYAPRQVMECVLRGLRFWQYELLDDPDPTLADRESAFGLVAVGSTDPRSWRRKPAFAAVAGLLAATADPGPQFTPDPVSIVVDGPEDLRWLILGRRNGTHTLVLWRDVDVYDRKAGRALTVEPATVSVATTTRSRDIRVGAELAFCRLAN